MLTTEFSFSEGGYLEGALRRANLIASQLFTCKKKNFQL